ncbi:uncharacterized protein PG986_002331 [Apiospora aurea]|uniref:Uncharacterized protein n=1 Tax=Apiospora aurea TaxID=335848 RepID=A0ABR1QZK2_9PEZI
MNSPPRMDMEAWEPQKPQRHHHQQPHYHHQARQRQRPPRPRHQQRQCLPPPPSAARARNGGGGILRNTGAWHPSEDERLLAAVAQHGGRWTVVADRVGTRTGDQCAKRWKENVNPELDHSPWTPEEAFPPHRFPRQKEERLLSLVEAYGHAWKLIANNFLEARPPLALKNRYSLLMRRFMRQERLCKQQPPQQPPPPPPPPQQQHRRPPREQTDQEEKLQQQQQQQQQQRQPLQAVIVDGGGGVNMAPGTTEPEAAATGWRGSDDMISQLATWGERNVMWQPQPSLLVGDGDLDPVPSATAANDRVKVDEIAAASGLLPDLVQGSSSSGCGGGGAGTPPGSGDGDGDRGGGGVEYAVTCRRDKLKTLVNHLLDVAMLESRGRAAEDDKVTVSLRFKV